MIDFVIFENRGKNAPEPEDNDMKREREANQELLTDWQRKHQAHVERRRKTGKKTDNMMSKLNDFTSRLKEQSKTDGKVRLLKFVLT